MTTALDSILSGAGEAAPASEQTTTTQPPAQTEGLTESLPDEFAEEGQGSGAEGTDSGQKRVPLTALHAERQKVKRYTEEVADFRRSNEALQRQVSELLQRIPAPQQQQQPKPDFFENPDAAVLNTVQTAVSPHIDRLEQVLMHNSQLIAGQVYGADKVKDAEAAFVQAVQSRTLDIADYQKVVNSPNRYAAAVEWHQQQMLRQEIGNDPGAYRARIEAEILAKHGLTQPNGQQPAQAAQQAAPVMPSNLAGARNVGSRSGPAWGGPQPIKDIFKR